MMKFLILHSDSYEPEGNWNVHDGIVTAANPESAVKRVNLENKPYLTVYPVMLDENGKSFSWTKADLDL